MGILALATKCYKHSPSPNLKRALVENTLAENLEEKRDNEKSQKCFCERVAAIFPDQSQNEVKQTQRNLGSIFNFTISGEQLLNNTIYP